MRRLESRPQPVPRWTGTRAPDAAHRETAEEIGANLELTAVLSVLGGLELWITYPNVDQWQGNWLVETVSMLRAWTDESFGDLAPADPG